VKKCPACGEVELVLSDARGERFYCDVCKHAWRETAGESYDDRRVKQTDVSGQLIDGP
jgi:uncharacterized Zn ribbon protein